MCGGEGGCMLLSMIKHFAKNNLQVGVYHMWERERLCDLNGNGAYARNHVDVASIWNLGVPLGL